MNVWPKFDKMSSIMAIFDDVSHHFGNKISNSFETEFGAVHTCVKMLQTTGKVFSCKNRFQYNLERASQRLYERVGSNRNYTRHA